MRQQNLVLTTVTKFWDKLRLFAFSNRTIFEIFFIMLYSFEQLLLVIITADIKNLQELTVIISIFVIIVLTTFSLHKVLMDSRIKLLEKDVNMLHTQKEFVVREYKNLHSQHEQLLDLVERNLNVYYFNKNARSKK